MKFIELLRTAFQSLKTNRKRSFLTIIGIMIGIAAVITILGMGDGVKKTMYDKFGNSKQGQQTTEIGYSSVDMGSKYMVLPKKISLILRRNLVQNLKM